MVWTSFDFKVPGSPDFGVPLSETGHMIDDSKILQCEKSVGVLSCEMTSLLKSRQ